MMFARGRRMFSSASIVMMLVAGLHTVGNLSTASIDAGQAAVQQAMRGYTLPLGFGMTPSIWQIFRLLVFIMSITVLALGALGLVLAADREVTGRTLRRVAWFSAAASAALAVICYLYQVPPPLISFVVTTILYAVAAAITRTGP
jgi:preprotein translocase subunit SecY